jgi:hypothetical protein
MIVYGDPETWGMTVDQFLDFRRLERESFANGTNPKIKMILDMLRRGMDVDTISTITGATIEEINSVAKKAKPISTEKPVGPEEGISKNKTYSEIDILSNIEAKFPGGNTRDDIVYNPMPNPVPRMDEYMPEFEGLEDPRYRQSELADGGIVEREEFNKGGEAKELRKLITSDREKFKKKFKPFLNKYFQNNLTQASEYLNLDRGRIQSIFRRSGEPLLTDRRRLSEAKPGGVDVADFNINIATDQNFKENLIKKLGSNSNYVDANELGGKLGIDVTDKKQKDYLLSILKKLNIKSKPNPISTRSRLYQISDSVKQLIKNPIKLIEGQAKSANLRKNYERNLDPELFNFKDSLKKITNNVTNQAGFKLDNEKVQKIEDIGHPISLQVASRYPKLFKNSNTVSLQSLIYQDPKLNRDILSKLGIDNSYSKIFEKLNSFVGKKITPEDQKIIRQLNKDMSDIRNRAVKLIQEEAKREPYFVGQEKRIPLIKADIPKVGSAFKSENFKADMSVVDDFYRVGQPNQINPNVNKFKDFTETEKLQYVENLSKQNADNVAKFFANVTDETTGRPVVPMNELNELKFTLETEINDNLKQYIKSTKVLENFNVKEQSALTEFGNKVAMGFDPADIIKALPEKEAQILKGVGSKIGNVAKLGARGAQELLVGTGPLGIGLTALISLPLAINELSEGARGSEAIQNTISDLTFGLTPRSDERIIKEIGGESAVKGMEIQKNIDDYKSITQEINNLENQMRDPSFLSLSPDDQDRIQSSLIQNEEALKEKENFLIPLINEKGKLKSPEYEDYLQADRKRQLERGLTSKAREQQSDIYDLGGETLREEEYVRPEASLLLDPLRKTFVGNQPKQTTYPSVMQGTVGEPVDNIIDRNFAYAVGGRVGFKKGSKDKDSPVIPISPLTDLPQNESRRDFLKGIGAVGLGAVALGTGAFKLAKSLKTKEALSLLGKEAVGQPEWFAPLVDKIILKGIRLEKDGKKLDSYVLQEGDKTLTLNKNPYGTIEVDVQGGGAYDDTFTLRYNNSIGKNMYGEPTEFRDFKIIESRPKYQVSGMDESGFDYDLEPMEEYFSGKDLLKLQKNATGILSDVEGLEKIATGKIKDPKLAKTRAQVRDKLSKKPADDRIIENYDYEYDIEIPHEYND